MEIQNTVKVPFTITYDTTKTGRDYEDKDILADHVKVLILDKEYTQGNSNNARILQLVNLTLDNGLVLDSPENMNVTGAYKKVSGTGTFTLDSANVKGSWGKDYYVYILAEKCYDKDIATTDNIDESKYTNYASNPVAIQVI